MMAWLRTKRRVARKYYHRLKGSSSRRFPRSPGHGVCHVYIKERYMSIIFGKIILSSKTLRFILPRSLYIRFLNNRAKRDLKRYSNKANIHFNIRKLYMSHLEEMKSFLECSKPDPQQFRSPIPRHDISEFNKLTVASDLKKFSKKFPPESFANPKMTDSPFFKYDSIFNRISYQPPKRRPPRPSE